jgi:hypothetical protein
MVTTTTTTTATTRTTKTKKKQASKSVVLYLFSWRTYKSETVSMYKVYKPLLYAQSFPEMAATYTNKQLTAKIRAINAIILLQKGF